MLAKLFMQDSCEKCTNKDFFIEWLTVRHPPKHKEMNISRNRIDSRDLLIETAAYDLIFFCFLCSAILHVSDTHTRKQTSQNCCLPLLFPNIFGINWALLLSLEWEGLSYLNTFFFSIAQKLMSPCSWVRNIIIMRSQHMNNWAATYLQVRNSDF